MLEHHGQMETADPANMLLDGYRHGRLRVHPRVDPPRTVAGPGGQRDARYGVGCHHGDVFGMRFGHRPWRAVLFLLRD